MRIILFGLALALTSLGAKAEVINVKQLNQLLKRTGAQWTAKTTTISQLSQDEARRHMGLPMEENAIEFRVPETKSFASLPVRFDWREKDGANWVTPILDQANCGSCVAFATIGVLETQYRIATGFAGFNIKLSPQHAFACGGGACAWGWFPEAASRYLQRTGAPDEACMPYTSGATGEDMACQAGCSDSSRRSVKISSFTTPSRSAKNIESVKQALLNGPLVTTLMVYADFTTYASGVYKHATGDMLGGHAISIIGYDDNLRAFAIRNSWGESWGEKGFGWVSYEDISGVGDSTWSYMIPALSGAVTVQTPVDYSYLTGTAKLRAHSTFSNTNAITMTVSGPSGTKVEQCSSVSQCESQIDTLAMADGRYEIQATALDANGIELGKSSHQFFFVANLKPSLTLSFAGTKGADLNRPVKDRIEMLVLAKSSTVPMTSVEFHFRGPDGKETSRTASIVVDGLTMGWRTTMVPNGNYEIWMTGRLKTDVQETVIESAHKTVQVAN